MAKKESFQEKETFQIKEQLKEKEVLLEEHIQQLQRVQAEFENYLKRSQKEKEEFSKYANHKLLSKILSLVDDFERAFALLKEESKNPSLLLGFEMMLKQFKKILEEEGVKAIESRGNKYNPYYHEVLEKVESELEEDSIVEELQKGYVLYDKILRPSRVKVSKGVKDGA